MNNRWTGKAVVMAILSLLIIGGAVVIPQFASAGGGVSHVSAAYSEVNGTLGNANSGNNFYTIEFTVGSSNEMVNYISFPVWGNTGWANITYFIGTTVGGNNVLANRSANFTGNGWHNITFPSVILSANTDYYFTLNRVAFSGADMIWNTTTPTVTKNFVGEYTFNTYSQISSINSGWLYTTGVTVYNIGGSYNLYSVTYTETGLASGTNWSVNQYGTVKYSTTPSIVYDESNGSYAFSIPSVPGYTVSPSSGTATVNGANITEAITFVPLPKYNITFREAGLPGATKWSVNVSGSSFSSNTSSLTFKEQNGSYLYAVSTSSPLYVPSVPEGTVTVSGKAITINKSFVPPNPHFITGMIGNINISSLSVIKDYGSLVKSFNWMMMVYNQSSIPTVINQSAPPPSSFFRKGDARLINVSAGTYVLVLLSINLTTGQQTYQFVSSFGGTLNTTSYTLEGYVPDGTYIHVPYVSVTNGTAVNAMEIKPQPNGFYKLSMNGNAMMIVNGTGRMPFFARIIPGSTKTEWMNVTTLPNVTLPSYNPSRILLGFTLNTSAMPEGLSLQSSTPVGTLFFSMLRKISYNDLQTTVAFSSTNSSGVPVLLNFSIEKGMRYRFFLTTNSSSNLEFNFSSTQKYFDFPWADWKLDPVANLSQYPVAVISAPTAVAYDSAVVLSGSGSYSNITNYTWHIRGPQNFTEYGKTPSVFFSLTGSYSISLTVTNLAGLSNTSSTGISVAAAKQDTKIIISAVKSTLGNGTVEYAITVTAKDNVSISSVTVMVGKAYVNVTLTKQTGYEYYYTLYLLPSKYAYGNYTVKITAWNSLDQYNSLTAYITFGSISQGGLFDYIISHSVLAIMFGIVVVLLIILIFVGEEHFEALHGKNGKKKRGREKGGKKR